MAVNAYYAGGRVAVLSQKLWSRDRFIRLSECADMDAALRMLYECGYGQGAVVENSNDYEQLLQNELSESVNFLKEMTSNPKVTDCFLLRYDYLNAKVMMKAKYMRIRPMNLYDCGLIDKDAMWEAISVDDYRELPECMQKALNGIDARFADGDRSPSAVDKMLDAAMYADLLARVKRCPVSSVKKHFTAEADTANIMALVRMKRANIQARESDFIGGATFKPSFLAETSLSDYDEIAAAFRGSVYAEFAEKACSAAKQGESLVKCDKMAADMKRQPLADNKNNFTVEPVICYYLSKITEIDNIRMILICVKNRVDKEYVKDRIKELYV